MNGEMGASTGQMRLLHVMAKQAGEDHGHIRDRAAIEFGIDSLSVRFIMIAFDFKLLRVDG